MAIAGGQRTLIFGSGAVSIPADQQVVASLHEPLRRALRAGQV